MKLFYFFLISFSLSIQAGEADSSLLQATLAPPASFFSTEHVRLTDYQLKWAGVPIDGISFEILPNTLEWAHVNDKTIVPRAVLQITAQVQQSGRVTYLSHSVPFIKDSRHLILEIPVVLSTEIGNEIDLIFEANGKISHGQLKLVYLPQHLEGTKYFLDSSCSPFDLNLRVQEKIKKTNWVSIGCRLRTFQSGGREQLLEVTVYWPEVGQSLAVNSIATKSQKPSRWTFWLSGIGQQLILESSDTRVEIDYSIADRRKKLDLALGIGPYFYQFESKAESLSGTYPVPTFYGSYRFSSGARFIVFDMTTLAKKIISDFGGYLQFNYLSLFDDRLNLTLMIGSHAVAYPLADNFYVQPDFAQGFEMSIVDFFAPRTRLALGAFVYPNLKDEYYFNVWLRVGRPVGFIELNYIAWQRLLGSQVISFRSAGVSVGFPLVSFL